VVIEVAAGGRSFFVIGTSRGRFCVAGVFRSRYCVWPVLPRNRWPELSVVPANSWLYDANGLAKPQRMAAIWPWLLGFSVTVFSHTLRSGPTNGGPGMLKNWQLVQAKPAPPINSWPGKHRRGMTERPVDTSPNGYIR